MPNTLKAVTVGDLKGIGIKILIKLWKNKRQKIGNFVLISNYILFKKYIKKNKINLSYSKTNNLNNIHLTFNKYFPIFDIKAHNNEFNAYKSIQIAYELIKQNQCNTMITLPINKEKIKQKVDKKFIGQTEFLQKLDNKKISNMIFYSKKLIVMTLTTHIPLCKIQNYFKQQNNIYQKIYSLNITLINDFNIKKPKLLICGINPHAGEMGAIGNEEIKLILPIIKKLKSNGININGPFSPDTAFIKTNRLKYDCIICTYHDQGLIPFKLISGFNGVNFTGSLDIVRTSPNHGTAYDLIKNNNLVNNNSLINSFKLANKIYKNRKIN